MSTRFRGFEADPGWIKREFAEIRRQLRELAAAKRLEAATIGKGGITVKGGDITLQDADGTVVWRASADPLIPRTAWAENNGRSLPTTWTDFWAPATAFPGGYISGHFLMTVSAGDSFTDSGNVSAQPAVKFIRESGAEDRYYGPAINSGNSSVSVATSFWSSRFTRDLAASNPYVSLAFGMSLIRVGPELTATSGNYHIAAQAIFRRGLSV